MLTPRRLLRLFLHAFAASLACLPLTHAETASVPATVVSQLHVVSVHVRDLATFNAVFRFFRDTLDLPLLYGAECDPAKNPGRQYAGFSVGNAYFEPCGPYPDDGLYPPDHPARWHGLTFLVANSIEQTAAVLDTRRIPNSGVVASRFVYVKDPTFVGPIRALSFWTWKEEPGMDVGLHRLESALHQAQGGALGIRRLTTVLLGFRAADGFDRWTSLLGREIVPSAELRFDRGPALRFIEGSENDVPGVELEVDDLTRTRRCLEKQGILGHADSAGVEVDPAKSFGLRLIFRQKI